MKQKFDVNTAIKGIRWMAFSCSGLSFIYIAMVFYFLNLASEDKGATAIPFAMGLLMTALPLGPVCGAFHGVFHVFRYQQSKTEDMQAEIDQLKAKVQQLPGVDQSAIST